MTPNTMPEWMTETERSWRASQLFYQHMDMAVMALKLKAQEYNKLGEFYADVVTVQHNVAVFHGSKWIFVNICVGKIVLFLRSSCYSILISSTIKIQLKLQN